MGHSSRTNNRAVPVFVLLLLSATGLVFTASPSAAAEELYLLSGAGLRQPVDELTQRFTDKTRIKVKIEYSGSGKLLARLKGTGQGDVYLPGSHIYVDRLKSEGQVLDAHPVVLHTPVLSVWRKTEKHIEEFHDLAAPGVRIGLGDPKAMALGRTAEEILAHSGLAGKIRPNVIVRAATVKQLALYVQRGDVDAAITGRTDAVQFKASIRMIEIDKDWYTPEIITAAVLKTSKHPQVAAELAAFLSSPSAVTVFEKYGFLPLQKRD